MIQSPTEAPPIAGSGSLPDENTSEAILYGSAYGWIKSAMWAWDEIENYYYHKLQNLRNQLMDRRFCHEVLTHNRYLIFARNPPVNNPNHLKDLMTLRELCRTKVALGKIDPYRRQNQAWARKQGIQEYVRSMAGRGISEAEWKAATASYNMAPINYNYVHGITEDVEDDFDWAEAMADLMGIKEYNALVDKMMGGQCVPDFMDPEFDRHIGRRIRINEDGEEEEYEYDEEEPVDEFWEGVLNVVDALFPDSAQDVLDSLEPIIDDECSKMADWVWKAELDDRDVVDSLIQYAKEVNA